MLPDWKRKSDTRSLRWRAPTEVIRREMPRNCSNRKYVVVATALFSLDIFVSWLSDAKFGVQLAVFLVLSPVSHCCSGVVSNTNCSNNFNGDWDGCIELILACCFECHTRDQWYHEAILLYFMHTCINVCGVFAICNSWPTYFHHVTRNWKRKCKLLGIWMTFGKLN
jgi:hypothetical protein